ncbi:MAG: hypothetical protein Q4C82_05020 [Eubacteriales bacterium]|nr:hypothetical protein [Eubacteriales bacterium]
MALVTICKYRRAKTPYFLEQAGLNLYSLEELSWFLYHNICLADRQMFDERLCRWLDEEVGCPELARRIRSGAGASGSSLHNLVVSVAGASDLFGSAELTALGERLKGLEKLQEQERLKLRADELLGAGNEWAAVDEYRRILRMHQNNRLGMGFYAAVWHNLGVCYARQFLFWQAAECFETSCEYARDPETERQADLAKRLAAGEKPESGKREPDAADPQRKLLRWEEDYRARQRR